MEVSVIGPGAVGTLLGGLLAQAGHGVRLIGKSAPPQRDGPLRIILPDRWLAVEGIPRGGPADAPSDPDVVLVTLGRHHLHALKRPDFLRLAGGANSTVVLSNGDPVETERLGVPADRWRHCVTLLNAVKLQDLDVELTSARPILIYEGSRKLDRLFRDLGSFGFQLRSVPDARPMLNSLLVWQLLMLPAAMCNTTLPVFLSFPEGRQLAAGLLAEGCAAMEKAGMVLGALPEMDPRGLAARLEKRPDSFEVSPSTPDRGYGSMLQSYLRGTPAEADRINRRIVEIGSSGGLHLTWNWRLLQKVSRVSGVGFYRTPADLLRSLV